LSSTKSAVADLIKKLNGAELDRFILLRTGIKLFNFYSTARTSEMVDIGQMPTSCADLQRMGQKISGFFLVKGAKKMEALYCNFYSNQNGTQSLPVCMVYHMATFAGY
jgi:hypothetical protein